MYLQLYNIHTHTPLADEVGKHCIINIVNTYPENFNNLKKIHIASLFSCGIHPWYSNKAEEQLSCLVNISTDPRILAIGEIGLDKLKGADLATQKKIFKKQIEIAIEVQKPIIIHCVKAWDELVAIRKEYKTSIPWIIHGYRGGVEQTKQLCKLGFKFSIGEFYNKEAIKQIPINSIFCETDESRLPIEEIYKNLATLFELEISDFASHIAANFVNNFILSNQNS